MPTGNPIDVELANGDPTVGSAFAVTITLDSTPTKKTRIQLTASDTDAISPLDDDDDFPLTLTVQANHNSITYWLSAEATGHYQLISAPHGVDISDSKNWTATAPVHISS